jgi:hypothetical protein
MAANDGFTVRTGNGRGTRLVSRVAIVSVVWCASTSAAQDQANARARTLVFARRSRCGHTSSAVASCRRMSKKVLRHLNTASNIACTRRRSAIF